MNLWAPIKYIKHLERDKTCSLEAEQFAQNKYMFWACGNCWSLTGSSRNSLFVVIGLKVVAAFAVLLESLLNQKLKANTDLYLL